MKNDAPDFRVIVTARYLVRAMAAQCRSRLLEHWPKYIFLTNSQTLKPLGHKSYTLITHVPLHYCYCSMHVPRGLAATDLTPTNSLVDGPTGRKTFPDSDKGATMKLCVSTAGTCTSKAD